MSLTHLRFPDAGFPGCQLRAKCANGRLVFRILSYVTRRAAARGIIRRARDEHREQDLPWPCPGRNPSRSSRTAPPRNAGAPPSAPPAATNPAARVGCATRRHAQVVSTGTIAPGAVTTAARDTRTVVSVVRGTATGIAIAVTTAVGVMTVVGVMTAGPGSGGEVPVPVTGGVRTGTIHGGGAETGETGSRVAVTISVAATVNIAVTTVTAGRTGGAETATSTGTFVATTVRGVSAAPGGTARSICTDVATASVAATTIADPGRGAVTSGNPVISIPSSRTR